MKKISVILICCFIVLGNSCAPDNSSRCIHALKKHLATYAGENANKKSASSILSHNACAHEKLVKLLKLYNPSVDYIEVIDPDVLVQFYTIRIHLSRSKEDAYIETIYEEGDKVIITGIGFKNRESNQWN